MAGQALDTKYKKLVGAATTKGVMYETKVSALLFLRGLTSGLEFQLATNVEGAGALDDVVFRIRNEAGGWTSFFMQLTHKDTKQITKQMLSHSEGKFALLKYSESYEEIKSAMSANKKMALFDGDIEDSLFVIFTNARPHRDLGHERCASEQIDQFLGTNSGKVFSFDPDGETEAEKSIGDSLKSCNNEGRDFLKRLRIFAAQPDEAKMGDLIKDELRKAVGDKAGGIDMNHLCDYFVENVKVWTETSKRVLHHESDVLVSALHRVSAETLSQFEATTNKLDLVFEKEALLPLKRVLGGGFPVVHIRSSEPSSRLTATKLMQTFDSSTFLFLGSNCFLKNQQAVMSEWGRGQRNTLVVSINTCASKDVERHFKKILETCKPEAHPKKRLVILADAKNKNTNDFTYIEDEFRFSNLTFSSREKYLGTEFILQGHRISLKTFLDGHCDDDVAVLSAPSVVAVLDTKQTLSVGYVLADPGEHYVPRSLEAFNADLHEYLRQEAAELENFTFINANISEIVAGFKSVASVEKQILLQTLERFADSFATDQRHENVFIGETFLLDSAECKFLGVTRDKATALWIRPPNSGWTLNVLPGASESDISKLTNLYKAKHTLTRGTNPSVYVHSSGNHEFIRKHFARIRPENVLEVEKRTAIIIGEPGMGKSTLMKYLSKKTKEAHPHIWVILIALNDHSQLFAARKHENAIEFLLNATDVDSSLQRSMLQSALEVTGNAVVILDGYDEIAPKYAEHCRQLLSNLLKTKATKVWVTTRLSGADQLAHHLATTPTNMCDFTEDDQRCFLKRYWTDARHSAQILNNTGLSEKELDDFISQITNISRSFGAENDFLGIPLQTQMMAEVFVEHVTCPSERLALPETLDLLKLLDMCVEKKLQVYVQEKLKIKTSDPNYEKLLDDNRSQYLANHVGAALQVLPNINGDLLPNTISTEAFSNFLEKVKSGEEKSGFIDGVVNGEARFVHRVFAEYFVAKWLAGNLPEYAKCLEGEFFVGKLKGLSIVSMRLCDLMLAKDCELHTAVLNGEVDKVKTLLAAGGDVNARDRGGRTPLHLSATTSFLYMTQPRHVEIVDLLLKCPDKDINSRDDVLNGTPIRYAAMNRYWLMLDKLLANNADPEDLTKTIMDNSPHLQRNLVICIDYILINDLDRLIGVFVDMYPELCNEPKPCFSTKLTSVGDGLLANACQSGSYRIATMLIDRGYDVNGLSLGTSSMRYPPLHCAAQSGHLELVKLLVDIKSKDSRKKQLQAVASGCKRLQAVASGCKRLQAVADVTDFVNRKANYGCTALHLAAKHGHADVVAFLIGKGADPASRDHVLCTCLHLTVSENRPDLVRVILDSLSDSNRPALVNLGNNKKTTVLHLAAKAGSLETVQVLVVAGAKMSRDLYDQTPLMLAARNGHLDIVKYLVKMYKNYWIGSKDKHGWTALTLASAFGFANVASYLTGQGVGTTRWVRPVGDKPGDYEDDEPQNDLPRCASVAVNVKVLDSNKRFVRVVAITGFVQFSNILLDKQAAASLNSVGGPSTRTTLKPVFGYRNVVDYFQNPSGGRLFGCESVSEEEIIFIQEMCILAGFSGTALYRDGFCGHASISECLACLPYFALCYSFYPLQG